MGMSSQYVNDADWLARLAKLMTDAIIRAEPYGSFFQDHCEEKLTESNFGFSMISTHFNNVSLPKPQQQTIHIPKEFFPLATYGGSIMGDMYIRNRNNSEAPRVPLGIQQCIMA